MKNIIILGCPRSGTSLTAKIVNVCGGYDLDNQKNSLVLRPNSKYNPDGYFERIDLIRLNDFLLFEMDMSFNFLNSPNLDFIKNYKSKNIGLLNFVNHQKSYNKWMLKDSRLAFTLNLYGFEKSEIKIIKVTRDRSQVKKSMINHYGNIFKDEKTIHGPYIIPKLNFDDYYDNINYCIDFQSKNYESIEINYNDILNFKSIDKIEEFINAKVDKNIIKNDYVNYH